MGKGERKELREEERERERKEKKGRELKGKEKEEEGEKNDTSNLLHNNTYKGMYIVVKLLENFNLE